MTKLVERIPDVSRMIAEAGDVEVETDAHGRITLRRRKFGAVRGRIVSLFGASKDFTIHLDPLGTAAWKLIDGVRTVGEIRVALVAQFPAESDVGARLGKFVGALVSHQMLHLR